ncbi:hypothetical protein AK812_SmicGene3862 [Symbiodinium microadriaticum]|uniref:Uncharacterized protein n=1 Tax=Symbiodinium microadriaticum TaxID=2951 RepID=A0A1Q9EXS2_SYMMI|nr:hypothetical protein AK812_SmicGene3862 [Symbiodinium microadriaticum]
MNRPPGIRQILRQPGVPWWQQEEEHKELHDFRKLAEKKVNQLFSAIVEQRNAKSLEKVLEGTVAKDADVGEGSTMCLWYDSKCAGEASSQPHCRVPKFRQNHFRTFLHATLGGRKLPQLDQKMLVCLSDGFSPSLGNSATTAFVLEDGTSVPKNRILFHNIYDAASLSAPTPTVAEGSRAHYPVPVVFIKDLSDHKKAKTPGCPRRTLLASTDVAQNDWRSEGPRPLKRPRPTAAPVSAEATSALIVGG